MTFFLLLVVLVAVLLAYLVISGQLGAEHFRYAPRKLMSSTEQLLYFRLTKALPEFCVYTMVPMSRVLKSSSMLGRGCIMQQTLDYVICKRDTSVVAVISLEDLSRPKQARRKVEKSKEIVFQRMGILFLRINLRHIPDEEAIQKLFDVVR